MNFNMDFYKQDLHTTHLLTKLFCKNMNIPINCYERDIFESRIELFNPFLNTKEKFKIFQKYINNFNTIEDIRNYETEIEEKILEKIKNPFYDDFIDNKFIYQNDVISKFLSTTKLSTIYNPNNHNKNFLSVDLKQANFSALKHYSYKIFDMYEEIDTWNDFIKQFTPHPFLQDSKHFREIIFGKLNPKKIQRYEMYLMIRFIFPIICSLYLVNHDSLICLHGDELIFELKNNVDELIFIHDSAKNIIKSLFNIDLNITIFKLINIDGINSGFLKLNYSNKQDVLYDNIDIKGVNNLLYPFIASDLTKLIYNKTLEHDFMKYYFYEQNTGTLARMLENPKYDIKISDEDLKGIKI